MRLVKKCVAMVFTGALAFTAYLGFEQIIGNFHTVVENEVYRSAQFTSDDLEKYYQQHHIKSVLNLRGENPHKEWYRREMESSKKLGIAHIDFAMSAKRELNTQQAQQLVEIMRNAPKPMLIHCMSGADRTGLASAIYLASIAHKKEWQAERQLWMDYGHLPLYFNASYAMDRTFERLEPLFGYRGYGLWPFSSLFQRELRDGSDA